MQCNACCVYAALAACQPPMPGLKNTMSAFINRRNVCCRSASRRAAEDISRLTRSSALTVGAQMSLIGKCWAINLLCRHASCSNNQQILPSNTALDKSRGQQTLQGRCLQAAQLPIVVGHTLCLYVYKFIPFQVDGVAYAYQVLA